MSTDVGVQVSSLAPKKQLIHPDNVIKIVALSEDEEPYEEGTSETMCSFSQKRAWQRGRQKSAEKRTIQTEKIMLLCKGS